MAGKVYRANTSFVVTRPEGGKLHVVPGSVYPEGHWVLSDGRQAALFVDVTEAAAKMAEPVSFVSARVEQVEQATAAPGEVRLGTRRTK